MITIVIPTMNRSDFVIRTLRYYVETGFSGTILLGDSSGPEHAARVVQYLDRIRDRLKVAYLACPGASDREAEHEMARMVQTPYAALMGDDDFLVPQGLAACVAFLDANPGFTGANGLAWAFTVEPASPGDGEIYGAMDVFDAYPQPEFLQMSAAARYAALMTDYKSTLFSVHRAETWREMWLDVLAFDDRGFGAELLPTTLSPVLGRVKHLDRMFLLRQAHGRRYLLPSGAEWMTHPRWQANYELYRAFVVKRIHARDDRPLGELDTFVRETFESGYLARHRAAGGAVPAAPPPAPPPTLVQRLVRRLRGSTPAAAPAPAFASPLADWLTPGSRHFADFDPVHRIVSNPMVQETTG